MLFANPNCQSRLTFALTRHWKFRRNEMRIILTVVLTTLFAATVPFLVRVQQSDREKTSEQNLLRQNSKQNSGNQQEEAIAFMRVKLAGSQQVLDGLVSENFELIRSGAVRMKATSEAVKWPTSDDPVYQHHGQAFRNQCDRLVELAEKNDLQGAHYCYLHLTTTCFNCHNHVRQQFRVEPAKDSKSPVQLIPGTWDGKSFRPRKDGK